MQIPELSAEAFSDYLEQPTDEDKEFAVDAYSHLGGFCYQAFANDNPRLRTGAVRHGFNVVSRMIRYAAKLYPEYANGHDVPADTDDLRTILLNSHDTPIRFATMPSGMNQVVESYFGLTNDRTAPDMRRLYKFESRTAKGTLFITDDAAFYHAVRDAEHQSPMTRQTAEDQCPMQRLTRETVWPAMVKLAADTPEAFSRDLAVERATT